MEKQRRLKQKDLVARLFTLFSEEADRIGAASLFDVELPMGTIREYLKDRIGVEYTSDAWIATQIRKYEDEIGVSLFRRTGDAPNGTSLSVRRDLRTYFQKRHLYTSQKIMTANGVLDLIRHGRESGPGGGLSSAPVTVLLGAGSTATKVAEFIAEAVASDGLRWKVATHNLGAIQILGSLPAGDASVEVLVPQGRVDSATYVILGRNADLYRNIDFEWIVQGTSFIRGGELYVENPEETEVNRAILRECSGSRALILTGHEAECPVPEGLVPFGSVSDYDYVVFPSASRPGPARERLIAELTGSGDRLVSWIKNWSYEILKRDDGSERETGTRRTAGDASV